MFMDVQFIILCGILGALKGIQASLSFSDCIQWPHYVDMATRLNVTSCVCTYQHKTSRHVTLTWKDAAGEIVAVTSATALDLSLPLSTSVLRKEDSGRPFSCEVQFDHVPVASIEYVPFLSYGPGEVNVISSHEFLPEDGSNVTLTCVAKVNPAPLFEWQGHYLDNASILPGQDCGSGLYSQALTFNPGKHNDGDLISCIVVNANLPSLALQADYYLRVKRGAQLKDDCVHWPRYVPPGHTACTCTFIPPARQKHKWTVEWLDPKGQRLTSLDTQNHEVSLALTSDLLHRKDSGRPHLCVVLSKGKVVHSSAQYVPFLAYGPEDVSVTGSDTYVPNNGANITLTCAATVNPAPVFQWRGQPPGAVRLPGCLCSNGTFSETLTFDPGAYKNGDVIECHVQNEEVPDITGKGGYTIHLNFDPPGPSSSDFPVPWVVATGVSGFLCLVLIAVVTVQFCRLRAHQRAQTEPKQPERRSLTFENPVARYDGERVPSNERMAGNERMTGNRRVPGNERDAGNRRVQSNERASGNERDAGNRRVPGNERDAGNRRVPGNERMAGNRRVPGNERDSGNLSDSGRPLARPDDHNIHLLRGMQQD